MAGFGSFLLSFPAFAEEAKVYTDQDLDNYRESAYDPETIVRRESDIRRWEEERDAERKAAKARDDKESLLTEKGGAEKSARVENQKLKTPATQKKLHIKTKRT